MIKLFGVKERPKDGFACFMALMCGLRINEIAHVKVEQKRRGWRPRAEADSCRGEVVDSEDL